MNRLLHREMEHAFPSENINVGGQLLHYLKIGAGPKLVLAFHGYANNASMFYFLEHPDYTVLSFDLPFQGKSEAVPGLIISKEHLQQLVKELMLIYNVPKIGLVGFSLGARVCLCMAEQMPEHIRNIVLVAPDGTRPNYFYQFLTDTAIGRFSFRGFVRFGTLYIQLFSLLQKLGLISRSLFTFAMQYIRTPESRQLLYNIWLSTSKLIPHLYKTKQNIKAKRIPVHLLMGQQDKVIPLQNALNFKGHSADIVIHVFDRGHNLLDFEEVRGTLAAWLFRTNPSTNS